MAEINLIKHWIREIRTVRPVSDDAILIRKQLNESGESTLITLLDTACCVPAICISKSLETLTREDLEPFSLQLNHQH